MPTETPFFFYQTCLECGKKRLTYGNGICPECCGKMSAERMGNLRDWQKQSILVTDVISFLSGIKASDLQGASRGQLLGVAEEYARFEDLTWKYAEIMMKREDKPLKVY